MFHILTRKQIEINTDPRRRCYEGCHYSSKFVFTEWEILEYNISNDSVERRLQFWKELNDYAVSQRGESARKEFKHVLGGQHAT